MSRETRPQILSNLNDLPAVHEPPRRKAADNGRSMRRCVDASMRDVSTSEGRHIRSLMSNKDRAIVLAILDTMDINHPSFGLFFMK